MSLVPLLPDPPVPEREIEEGGGGVIPVECTNVGIRNLWKHLPSRILFVNKITDTVGSSWNGFVVIVTACQNFIRV